MKKLSIITMSFLLCFALSQTSNAQGYEPGAGHKQFNFGLGTSGWGVNFFGGFDFGMSDKVTIGPWVGYRTNTYVNAFTVGFRGDYHYGGHIPALPEELDLYGGLGVGYTNVSNDRDYYDPIANRYVNENNGYVDVWLRAGARYFFHQNWGGMVEVTGASRGNLSGAQVGLSYRF